MDDNSTPPMPREVLEVLEVLTTAEAFAEPIMMLAERLKEKQLGDKAGQVLHTIVNEFVAVLKPLYEQLEGHLKLAREERLKFIQQATSNSIVSEGTALALLNMSDLEHKYLVKSAEGSFWKWKAENPSKADGKNPFETLLKDLQKNMN